MSQTNIFKTIFTAKCIAIVGASRSPHKVGYQLVKNLLDDHYPGQIYPINPNAKTICTLRAYPSLSHLPQVPPVIIVATPAALVVTIIAEAARLGVKAAIVITAGFAEAGESGKAMQSELAQLVKASRLRLIGPNCLGVLSTPYQLNATFGPRLPASGQVMLISQSGALVTGILDWLNFHHLGLSHAITLGNRLDVSEIDALEYAATDKNTQVVLMYLESFLNAPEYFALASRVSAHKPVLLLKGGATAAGQSASASHTAALATNQVLIDALATQTGVSLSQTYEDWLMSATFFTQSPVFKGQKIMVVTNAGGPGVLVADALVNHHLELAQLTPDTLNKLKSSMTLTAYHNPLDILGDADPDRFHTALGLIKKDPNWDGLLLIMTPQTSTQPLKSAAAVITALTHEKRPVAAILVGGEKLAPAKNYFTRQRVPVFSFPDEAVSRFAAKVHFDVMSHLITPFTPPQTHKKHLDHPLTLPYLDLKHAFKLLKDYHFQLPRSRIIDDVANVPDALNFVTRPAVIKTAAMRLPHKAKLGGVILDVMTVSQARLAFRHMQTFHPEVLFQQTVHGQVELIIGARRDPQLGPFVTVGLGGSHTNAYADRAYAFIPTTIKYLSHVFATTKAFQAIHSSNLPDKPVIEALDALSHLVIDHPEIAEIEINPAILATNSLYAADIKITLLAPNASE